MRVRISHLKKVPAKSHCPPVSETRLELIKERADPRTSLGRPQNESVRPEMKKEFSISSLP